MEQEAPSLFTLSLRLHIPSSSCCIAPTSSSSSFLPLHSIKSQTAAAGQQPTLFPFFHLFFLPSSLPPLFSLPPPMDRGKMGKALSPSPLRRREFLHAAGRTQRTYSLEDRSDGAGGQMRPATQEVSYPLSIPALMGAIMPRSKEEEEGGGGVREEPLHHITLCARTLNPLP